MGILERMQCSIQQGLIRDMKQEFIRLTDQGNITEYSDSGMEDGAISPVSSVDSEIDICRNKSPLGSDVVQSHPIPLVKPQVLTPSESSAFSKIDKWTPTYTPSLASFPPVCSTSAVGYLPGFFISPWIAESFQRGYQLPPAPMMYGSPDTSPSKSSDEMLRSPESVTDKIIQSPEKHAFYHVDPRIPFTNYFMNLTKLLQKDDDATKNKQDQQKSTSDDKIGDTRKDECFRYSDRLSETKNRSPSPVLMTAELEDSKEDTKELVAPEPVPHIDHLRGISMEATPKTIMPAQSDLFPVPGSLDRLGPYPPLAPSTSMMPIMGGMGLTPSSGMFHPAFLQMAGIGGKRAHHADKPTPVKKYKCDVCGKAFSRSNTLVTHKRIHTGDKPFKCEVCGRAFRQPGNLTRHRLTHTTVKPYVCPQCNKAFNRASNLHTHMRTHTNYKPFVCPYCGKGFHQKIDMKIHCYTHTGQRPHRCDVCGKGFTLASTLSTHRRIHFDTRSFPATSFPASASVVSN